MHIERISEVQMILFASRRALEREKQQAASELQEASATQTRLEDEVSALRIQVDHYQGGCASVKVCISHWCSPRKLLSVVPWAR